jgi:predicted secreted hydrolase
MELEKKQPEGHWFKMSTASLGPTAHAQRISIHLQHFKARLIPRNTCPPSNPNSTSHHLAISTTRNKKNMHTARLAACEYGQSLVRQ